MPRLRDLRVVGQIGSGYILVDEPLAAWIVDQHVAHERALLDRLTDPEDEQMPTIQSLLVPEVVELPPQDAAEAADSLEELSVYGFEVEPFGKASFRINGVISTLADRDVAGAFREAVSAMKGTAPGMSRGAEDPRHHSVPLCGKAWRQALLPGDGGADKGVAHQPLPGYVSAWTLDLLPARTQGDSPQAGQALDYICQRFDYPLGAAEPIRCPLRGSIGLGVYTSVYEGVNRYGDDTPFFLGFLEEEEEEKKNTYFGCHLSLC